MVGEPINPNTLHEASLRDYGGRFHLSRVGHSATRRSVRVGDTPEDEGNALFNAAVDGLESLLLALYAAGIGVALADGVGAINPALSAPGDRYSYT